jgi:hypothetical protein
VPIDYERDDRRRLITLTLIEPFSLDELLSQTDRQSAEQVWEYAVLYDGRATWTVSSPGDLQQLVMHTQVVGGGRPRGPVGVAAPRRPASFRSGLEFAKLPGPRREIEILFNDGQVDAWLVRHAPRRGAADGS